MNYKRYLKSETWNKKKKQTKYWHGKRCSICKHKKIDIHHKTYTRIGNEDVKTDLIPLCRYHHYLVHEYAKEKSISIYKATQLFLSKRPRKKTWKEMTPYERSLL